MRTLDPAAVPPAPLPRGRHSRDRAAVAASQHERLLDAMTEAVAAHGYGAVRLADVARGAGVSLSTFYAHFAGKPECFAAAYDAVATALIDGIEAAARTHADPAGRLAAALAAYLAWFAARPSAARAYLVEVHAAGQGGLEARSAVLARFAKSSVAMADGVADAEMLAAFLLVVDALAHEEVVAGRVARLAELEPRLLEIAGRMLVEA